jgi:uncharacterized protein (DUF697 family)
MPATTPQRKSPGSSLSADQPDMDQPDTATPPPEPQAAAAPTVRKAPAKSRNLASIVKSSPAAQLWPADAKSDVVPIGQKSEIDHAAIARILVAENQIKTYVIGSVAASIVPIPVFDIAAVAAIQLRMIQKLSDLYDRPFSESAVRNVVAALGGGVFGFGAGAAVAVSLAKFVPGIGWMLGMVSLPVVAGATTYAIGRVFVRHYEEGGSVFDLRADTMRGYYQQQYEKGRAIAASANRKGGR